MFVHQRAFAASLWAIYFEDHILNNDIFKQFLYIVSIHPSIDRWDKTFTFTPVDDLESLVNLTPLTA